MKILFFVILSILVLLAVSSGITKIMLLQQEVDFFGQYGFTNPVLVIFGIFQLIGGILLAIPKTRIIGAMIVGVTFLISAVVLTLAGSIPVTIVTLFCVLLLGFVIKKSLKPDDLEIDT